MPLAKFTGSETCPKCGAEGPTRRYVERDDCEAAAGQPHLHLRCNTCGFDGGNWIVLGQDVPVPPP